MNDTSTAGSSETNSYDEVDYPGYACAESHPARLAAIGMLRGMRPAPVGQCRVLEIGCGDATNLIAMAYQLPDARFVGVDRAAAPIERGRHAAAALGLDNLELHVMDVLQLTPDMGSFDYIIAHGFYSWVPERVRDRLLDFCGTQLTGHGIAFVSYLAQPGSMLRDMLRDFLLHFASPDEPGGARVPRVRELARLFSLRPKQANAQQELLRSLAAEVDSMTDGAIVHDWLAPHNAAQYVTDFVAHANRHGLAFLGEAEYYMMRYEHDPLLTVAHAELARREAHDVIAKEMLLDFLRCRRFRQTLLCRAEVPLSTATPAAVGALAVAAPLRLVGDPAPGVAEFRTARDARVQVDHPVVQAALSRLGRAWPRAIPFAELLATARAEAGSTDPADAAGAGEALGRIVLACAAAAHAELFAWAPQFALHAGERPRASAVARQEITRSTTVTTLRHESLQITDPLRAALLRLLDGTRDRNMLVAALTTDVLSGDVPLPGQAAARRDVRPIIADSMEAMLADLARLALLEA